MQIQAIKRMGMALVAVATLAPISVFASTAANTVISNTVTVDYANADGSQTYQETASVALTVNLVESAALITTEPADIDPTSEGATENLVYTITSTANGDDTYDITPSSSDTDLDAPTFGGDATITLGGTTVAATINNGDTTITVPYDGSDDDIINTLSGGETIVIDPNGAAIVATIAASGVDTSNGPTNNTATITLTAGLTLGSSIPVGTIIGERADATVTITAGNLQGAAVSGTHAVSINVASQTGTNPDVDSGTTNVVVRVPDLTVTKYVRNDTNPNGTGTSITVNGNTYYDSGVNGDPDDLMEYLIVIDNTTAGSDEATAIVISDPVPQFTTYETGTMALDSDTTSATGSGSFTAIADGDSDGDAGEFDSAGNGTVYIYAGNGGDDGAAGVNNGTGGSLDQGEYSFAIFQVRIDN
jgi:hypothetical protein